MIASLALPMVRQSDQKLIHVDSYSAAATTDDDSANSAVQVTNAALEQIFATFTSELRH